MATTVATESSRIFISYRREDSEFAASRLADDLSRHFGHGQVFQDFASIDPGADFVEAVHRGLDTCAAVLVVIGPRWIEVCDRKGRRRLEVADDWVRYEVAASLCRSSVRVFPVLVGDSEMPGSEDLPDDLLPLIRRQAFPLTVRYWQKDVAELVEHLRRVPGLDRTYQPLLLTVEPLSKTAEEAVALPPSVEHAAAAAAPTDSLAAGTSSETSGSDHRHAKDAEQRGEKPSPSPPQESTNGKGSGWGLVASAARLKWWAMGLGTLAVVVAIALFPGARAPLPLPKTPAAHPAPDLAPLADKAGSLLQLVDAQGRGIADALQTAAGEVAQARARVAAAANDEDRRSGPVALFEAEERQEIAEQVLALYAKASQGPQGIAALSASLDQANEAAKAGYWQQATVQYGALIETLNERLKLAPSLRGQVVTQREQWLQAVAGKWAVDDCGRAATFRVKDRTLQINWPPHGNVEERVLKLGQSEVVTVVATAGQYKGKLSRYTLAEKVLVISNIADDHSVTLKRCP